MEQLARASGVHHLGAARAHHRGGAGAARAGALREEIEAAEARVQTFQEADVGSQAARAELNLELAEARLETGLLDVRGPGMVLEISDSLREVPVGESATNYIVLVDDLRDIVTALWASGAEAISISGGLVEGPDPERLVATSSIYGAGSAILVNAVPLSPPFRIEAIGPEGLHDRFLAHPSFLARVALRIDAYGLEFASEARDELTLPAFIGNTRAALGHAALGGGRVMAARIAQISLFGVALIIGLLLVGQLRSQARPIELSNLSAQELSELIETLNAANVELSDGLDELRAQIRDYESAAVEGQSDTTISEEVLLRISAFGGLVGMEGQGIQITAEGSFDPIAVNDLIHELRNAGAEAIAIDDIRITARSVAVLGTSAIEIDGVAIGPSFEIRAIGSPDGLQAAIERPGGILSLYEQSIDARFTVSQVDRLILPPTERDLAPAAARPVE